MPLSRLVTTMLLSLRRQRCYKVWVHPGQLINRFILAGITHFLSRAVPCRSVSCAQHLTCPATTSPVKKTIFRVVLDETIWFSVTWASTVTRIRTVNSVCGNNTILYSALDATMRFISRTAHSSYSLLVYNLNSLHMPSQHLRCSGGSWKIFQIAGTELQKMQQKNNLPLQIWNADPMLMWGWRAVDI